MVKVDPGNTGKASTARTWFAASLAALHEPYHVVVPNQRLALFLARDWAYYQRTVKQQQVWQPLSIQPFREWLTVAWQHHAHQQGIRGQGIPYHLTPQEAFGLWQELCDHRHAQDALEADYLSREWALVFDESQCADHQRQQYQWQVQYREWKQRQPGLVYDDIDILQWFCDHPATLLEQHRTFVFYGFIEFSPLQQRCIDSLAAQGAQIITELRFTPPKPRHIECQQWAEPVAELKGAAHWVQRTWSHLATSMQYAKDDLFDGPRVAIIVPDLAQHQDDVKAVMSEVFQWQVDLHSTALPWTISAGQALADYPLIATLLRIFDLCFDTISIDELEVLLCSPYWGSGQCTLYASGWLTSLRATGQRLWCLAQFHRFVVQQMAVGDTLKHEQVLHLELLLAWLDQLLQITCKPRPAVGWQAWLERLMSCIEQAQWPGAISLSSVDYQLMQRWHQWWLLQHQSSSQPVIAVGQGQQSLTYRQASHQLKKDWQELMFQPEASTDRVLVLGMLEAAALPLDAVYIVRLSAEHWPSTSQPNPFLPYELQRAAQLPRSTPLREMWYSAALLRLYQQSSGQLALSFSRTRDDVPQFASPLLQQVFGDICQVHAGLEQVSPQWQARLIPQWQEHEDQFLPLEPKPLEPKPGIVMRDGIASVSQQGLCPFRGGVSVRLNATPVSYTQVSITAADRGRWLHKVLELLWQEAQSHTHCILNQLQQQSVISNAIAQVLVQAKQALPTLLTPTLIQVEQQRLFALVAASLALEREREPFTVQAVEARYPLHIAGFYFQLRLDRWDLQENRWVLIDYKSSQPRRSEDRQLAPQLVLYALCLAQYQGVAEQDIPLFLEQAVYYVIKPSVGAKWVNMIEHHQTCKQWLQQELSLLLELLDEIKTGYCQPKPYEAQKTCQTCHYQSYCRIDQRQQPVSSSLTQECAQEPSV